MPKRRRENEPSTPDIRTVVYTASELNPSNEHAQKNVFVRASHDTRGRVTTEVEHSVHPTEKAPALSEIFAELDIDTVPLLSEDFYETEPLTDVDDDFSAEDSQQVPGQEATEVRNSVR